MVGLTYRVFPPTKPFTTKYFKICEICEARRVLVVVGFLFARNYMRISLKKKSPIPINIYGRKSQKDDIAHISSHEIKVKIHDSPTKKIH